MSDLSPYRPSPESIHALRSSLLKQPEVVAFKDEPKLASLVACLGLQREFGTLNDEMAPFVFDAETSQPVAVDRIRSELVQYHGALGIRVWGEGVDRLDLRFSGIRELLHPRFSFREDGSIRQCVLFPESVARIAALRGVDLVLVRDWGMNTIFGGFDPSKHYYQTNFWELENNDTLRFARLLERRRIPFLGTHDLVAHIAGIRESAWGALTRSATEVRETIEDYLREARVPTVSSLVIPYLSGVLLDDLAQPPNYNAPGRRIVISEALRAIETRRIDPLQPRVLTKFPKAFEKNIRLARERDSDLVRAGAKRAMVELVNEIHAHSAGFNSSVPSEDKRTLAEEAKSKAEWD